MTDNNRNKTIYFVRHPKTEAPDGVCYGNSDVLPNEKALAGAVEKVLLHLEGISPDICYSSPLSRCRLLAEKIILPEKVQVDELIREINFASWEMKPWQEIPPEEQEIWGKDFINCKIHGGENFFDVQERVIRFWKKITRQHYEKILVVTHAGLLRALLAYLLEASPNKIFAVQVDYGDVIKVSWSNDDYYKIKFL